MYHPGPYHIARVAVASSKRYALAPPQRSLSLSPTTTSVKTPSWATPRPLWEVPRSMFCVPLAIGRSRFLTDFKILRVLGQGSDGIVVEIQDRRTKKRLAAKVMVTDQEEKTSPSSEADILRKLGPHPNIVKCYDEWVEPCTPSLRQCLFSSLGNIGADNFMRFIILELCDRNTLQQWLQEPNRTTTDTNSCIRGIISGISQIHSHGVIHMDIKPANILFQSGVPKIADFSMAFSVSSSMLLPEAGTAVYAAPELTHGASLVSFKSDIYSAGIICFEMCSMFKTGMERIVAIENLRDFGEIPQLVQDTHPEVSKLIKEMTCLDPMSRPLASEVLQRLPR